MVLGSITSRIVRPRAANVAQQQMRHGSFHRYMNQQRGGMDLVSCSGTGGTTTGSTVVSAGPCNTVVSARDGGLRRLGRERAGLSASDRFVTWTVIIHGTVTWTVCDHCVCDHPGTGVDLVPARETSSGDHTVPQAPLAHTMGL